MLLLVGFLVGADTCMRRCPQGKHWQPFQRSCEADKPGDAFCGCYHREERNRCVPCPPGKWIGDEHHRATNCERTGTTARKMPRGQSPKSQAPKRSAPRQRRQQPKAQPKQRRQPRLKTGEKRKSRYQNQLRGIRAGRGRPAQREQKPAAPIQEQQRPAFEHEDPYADMLASLQKGPLQVQLSTPWRQVLASLPASGAFSPDLKNPCWRRASAGRANSTWACAVSYTHLTLPTICSV